MITKSSVVEIKTSLWIPNHDLLSQTLNNNNFYLSTFPVKLNNKIFQNNEKTLFWGHFYPTGMLPKNSGYVQLQWSPSIQMSKIQSGQAIQPNIILSLWACKNHLINLLNSSNNLWETTDLRVPWSIKPRSFFIMPTQ